MFDAIIYLPDCVIEGVDDVDACMRLHVCTNLFILMFRFVFNFSVSFLDSKMYTRMFFFNLVFLYAVFSAVLIKESC